MSVLSSESSDVKNPNLTITDDDMKEMKEDLKYLVGQALPCLIADMATKLEDEQKLQREVLVSQQKHRLDRIRRLLTNAPGFENMIQWSEKLHEDQKRLQEFAFDLDASPRLMELAGCKTEDDVSKLLSAVNSVQTMK